MKASPFIFLTALASSTFADEAPLLELTKGDRWEYQVTVVAPHGAQMPKAEGVKIKKTADGIRASFKKTRVYLGKTKPTAESQELDTFQMLRSGKVLEFEYSDFRKDAIYTLGSKNATKENSQVLLLAQPLLVYAAANKPGDQWEVAAGDGEKTPIFTREFRVFGEEEVQVPAGTFTAVRVVMTGQSGPTEIKQTIWFTKGIGFVKEEKTYYSARKRLLHQVMELNQLTKGVAK